MNIEILSRSAVPSPTSGHAYLFFDADNNKALTARFSCGSFRVLSEGLTSNVINQSLIDAQNDILNNIGCAVSKGVVSMADYILLLNAFNLYYQKVIDSDGNIIESITTTHPTPPVPSSSDDFDVSFISGVPYLNGVISIGTISSGGAATASFSVIVDKKGAGSGDIVATVSTFSGGSDLTLTGNSYVSDNLGVVTTSSSLTIVNGTSLLYCTLAYGGVAVAGTYTALITLTRGSVVRYIPISVVLQP